MKNRSFFVAGALLLASLFTTSCDQIASSLDNPVKSYLSLEKDSVLLLSGQTTTINPKSINDNGKYSFESSDKNVATVDEKGVVTAVGAGLATITVKVAADDYYQEGTAPFKVKVYGVIGKATEPEIGMLVCQDGHIHADKDAECTKNRIAMLAYVGNKSKCAHGLAIALWDAGTGSWTVAVNFAETWGDYYPVTGGTWRLPSTDDWQYMFIGCGGTKAYKTLEELATDSSCDPAGLQEKLGDYKMLKGYYWTSDETAEGSSLAWEFYPSGSFGWYYKYYSDGVRYCLAF